MTVGLNHRIDGSGPRVLLLHAVGIDLMIPGATHMAFFDMPEKIASAVGGLLREVLV